MKKQLSIPVLVVIILSGILLTASAFQEKGNKSKNDKSQRDKGNPNENKIKGNRGNAPANNANRGNDGQGKSYDKKEQANKGQGNDSDGNRDKGNNSGNGNKGNNGNNKDENRGQARASLKNNWYSWTRENFKDRSKLRGKDKVTICHKIDGKEPVNIRVSSNALQAHRNHGDVAGECPPVTNSSFSDIFNRRRTTYYNDLEYGQDQYYYSNSVLDYALMRLSNSRSELNRMRANNAAQDDIDRRQESVVQLEENVSLLETALGLAGQLLADRL